MNEHKTPANEQATPPTTLPVKNNMSGTAKTAANRKKTPGETATTPARNEKMRAPVKQMNTNQYNMMQVQNQRTYPKPYEPAMQHGNRKQPMMQETGFYPVAAQPSGYYPPAVPETEMYPQAMAQTDLYQPGMPQRSIFQPTPMMQDTMQQPMPARTSIMTSGLGAGDSVLVGTDFTQGFLRTQIGRHVKVEFLIGTNMLIDRDGDLVRVGTDYIIIQETETDDYLLCDMYSIKFIRFYY